MMSEKQIKLDAGARRALLCVCVCVCVRVCVCVCVQLSVQMRVHARLRADACINVSRNADSQTEYDPKVTKYPS